MFSLTTHNFKIINNNYDNYDNTINMYEFELDKCKNIDIFRFNYKNYCSNNELYIKYYNTNFYCFSEEKNDNYFIHFLLPNYIENPEYEHLLFHFYNEKLKKYNTTKIEYSYIYNDFIDVCFSGKDFYNYILYEPW